MPKVDRLPETDGQADCLTAIEDRDKHMHKYQGDTLKMKKASESKSRSMYLGKTGTDILNL